jgi:hypothetical protein
MNIFIKRWNITYKIQKKTNIRSKNISVKETEFLWQYRASIRDFHSEL